MEVQCVQDKEEGVVGICWVGILQATGCAQWTVQDWDMLGWLVTGEKARCGNDVVPNSSQSLPDSDT